jgi:hypothetical protein
LSTYNGTYSYYSVLSALVAGHIHTSASALHEVNFI